MRQPALLLAVAAALAWGAPAAAQVFTPTFQSTERGNDLGIYLSDGPGELAVEGIWRRGFGSGDLGLRGGFIDAGDGALLLGADWRQPLALGTAPVDLALSFGGQAAVGGVDAFGVQAGLIFGHTFTEADFGGTTSAMRFTPYVHPRLALVSPLDDDGAELDVLADLGVDLGFAPNLSLRLGISLGDGADWGVGLAWRH
jgi:hypothetical protein